MFEREALFELIFCMSFVLSDRLSESRSWMSMSPKDGRKRSKETRRGFFTFLTWWLLPEEVLRRIEEACREQQVVLERDGVERMTGACGRGNAPMVMSSGRGNECGAR